MSSDIQKRQALKKAEGLLKEIFGSSTDSEIREVQKKSTMSKPTINLCAPMSLRLRPDQDERLEQYIDELADEERARLVNEDRNRMYHQWPVPVGRPPSLSNIILRLALDDWLDEEA